MNLEFLNKTLSALYDAEELAQSKEELIYISQQIEETKLLIADMEINNGTVVTR